MLLGSKSPSRKTTGHPDNKISAALSSTDQWCCSPDSVFDCHIRNSQLDFISLTCSQLSLLLLFEAVASFQAAWELL